VFNYTALTMRYITHQLAFGCRWPWRGKQTSLKWRRALYRELSFEWHKLHSYSFVGGRNKFDAKIVAVDCVVCLWLEHSKGCMC
jgi:hypothetical protein